MGKRNDKKIERDHESSVPVTITNNTYVVMQTVSDAEPKTIKTRLLQQQKSGVVFRPVGHWLLALN